MGFLERTSSASALTFTISLLLIIIVLWIISYDLRFSCLLLSLRLSSSWLSFHSCTHELLVTLSSSSLGHYPRPCFLPCILCSSFILPPLPLVQRGNTPSVSTPCCFFPPFTILQSAVVLEPLHYSYLLYPKSNPSDHSCMDQNPFSLFPEVSARV